MSANEDRHLDDLSRLFRGPLDFGIVRRARETGLVDIGIHDLRNYTKDKHRTVDDRPFGGGEGMVLKPEPIFECLESLGSIAATAERRRGEARQSVILLSAQGRRLDQRLALKLSALERIVLICGRYEGVDERISEHLADREISVGDYVLSGGELGAAVIVDTVTRLIPGAVGNADSTRQESFTVSAEAESRADCTKGGAHPAKSRRSGPTTTSRRARHVCPVDCWIIHITRGQRTFAGWRFRKCW